MKFTNLILLVLIGISFSILPCYAQPGDKVIRENKPLTIEDILEWHEVYTYEVKYTLFKLGEVEVQVVGDTLYEGRDAWHVRGKITSSGLFIGNEENHYNSIFDIVDGKPRELTYWKDDIDGNNLNKDRFRYDYENEKVYSIHEDGTVDTLELKQPATSGPLMFFYSRFWADRDDTTEVHVYQQEEMGTIDLFFTSKRDKRGYKPFDEDIPTFYFEGDADINGPFGFKGRFESWVADTRLRLPVESRLKVWIGKVKVRLIDYKRESWK